MTDRIDWIISEHEGKIENTKDLYPLYSSYVAEFGEISEETFKRYCRSAKDLLEEEDNIVEETEQFKQETILKSKKQTDNNLEIALTSYEINSAEKLIEWADIDTNVWELYSQNIRSSSNLKNPWFICDCKFRLKDQSKISAEEYVDRFKALLGDYSVPSLPPLRERINVEDIMAQINIMDFHFGQASWDEETRGSNYDINVASDLLDETVDYFIQNTIGKVGKYLLPIGNDFFNVNSEANTTYGNTPQDEDANFKKTHLVAEQLWIKQIDKLAQIAPVEVVCISGNHDKQRLWYLGNFLSAWYRDCDYVTIDNTPPQRKYVRFGKTLIGFTHGNNEVRNTLPMLMAQEMPVDFSETKFREWNIGHLHGYSEKNTRLVKESHGIREIVIPSLVPLDAWHASKGYGQLREAMCFMWDKSKGKTTTYYFHPE